MPAAQVVPLSPVQQTILDQLRALNPTWRASYGLVQLLTDGANKLRLHCFIWRGGRRRVLNVDVEYNPIPDLYTLKAYAMRCEEWMTNPPPACHTLLDSDGIYWEQLDDLITQAVKEARAL